MKLLAWAISAAISLTVPTASSAQSPQEAANMQVFRNVVAIWESGDVSKLACLIAPAYVGHPAAGDRDFAGLKARIAAFRAEYPDAKFTVEDQIASGDKVATRLTATATSRASGKAVRLYGLNISRFSAGRMVEEWPVWEVKQ